MKFSHLEIDAQRTFAAELRNALVERSERGVDFIKEERKLLKLQVGDQVGPSLSRDFTMLASFNFIQNGGAQRDNQDRNIPTVEAICNALQGVPLETLTIRVYVHRNAAPCYIVNTHDVQCIPQGKPTEAATALATELKNIAFHPVYLGIVQPAERLSQAGLFAVQPSAEASDPTRTVAHHRPAGR